jgi:hypothetical protein
MKFFVLLLCGLVMSATAAPSQNNHGIKRMATEAVLGFTHGRVVGGVDAIPGEFPFIVSIQWILLTASTHVSLKCSNIATLQVPRATYSP